ncbi:hypothetical protein B7P43_G13310, partial [Cryptotermes secundus]
MCDDQVSGLQKTQQSIATRLPKIVLQKAEEIFPSLKGIMICLGSQKDVPGSYVEALALSYHNGVPAVNIKVEEFSDMEDGEDPVPMTILGTKAEYEKDSPGLHSEACSSSSRSGVQAVNIKIEESSDIEDSEDPVPMTLVGIKAEYEEDAPASHSETCASPSLSGDQAFNIKVEEFSDIEDREDPVPMPVEGIKAEYEDSLDSQEDEPASHSEACASSSLDGVQAVYIKVEEFSDIEDSKDSEPMAVVGIKAE